MCRFWVSIIKVRQFGAEFSHRVLITNLFSGESEYEFTAERYVVIEALA